MNIKNTHLPIFAGNYARLLILAILYLNETHTAWSQNFLPQFSVNGFSVEARVYRGGRDNQITSVNGSQVTIRNRDVFSPELPWYEDVYNVSANGIYHKKITGSRIYDDLARVFEKNSIDFPGQGLLVMPVNVTAGEEFSDTAQVSGNMNLDPRYKVLGEVESRIKVLGRYDRPNNFPNTITYSPELVLVRYVQLTYRIPNNPFLPHTYKKFEGTVMRMIPGLGITSVHYFDDIDDYDRINLGSLPSLTWQAWILPKTLERYDGPFPDFSSRVNLFGDGYAPPDPEDFKPNLRGRSLTLESPNAAPNMEIDVDFSIENTRPVATGRFTVSFFLSAQPSFALGQEKIGEVEIASFAEVHSQRHRLRIPESSLLAGVPSTPGQYYIGMYTDSKGEVDETNETDNYNLDEGIDWVKIQIDGDAIIKVNRFDAQNDVGGELFAAFSPVHIEWTVQNVGWSPADDITLEFLINPPLITDTLRDGHLGEAVIPQIAPGEEISGVHSVFMPLDNSRIYSRIGDGLYKIEANILSSPDEIEWLNTGSEENEVDYDWVIFEDLRVQLLPLAFGVDYGVGGPRPFVPGAEVSYFVRYLNDSTTPLHNDFDVQFYLSPRTGVSPASAVAFNLANYDPGFLGGGVESYTVGTLILPGPSAPIWRPGLRTYYLGYDLDHNETVTERRNRIPETDETDNTFPFGPLAISVNVPAPSSDTYPLPNSDASLAYTSDGTEITITSLIGAGSSELTIPEAVDGLPVSTIAAGAFEFEFGLRTVIVPPTVTTIADDAFAGSANLTEIRFQGDAPTLGSGVFAGVGESFTAVYPKDARGYRSWPAETQSLLSGVESFQTTGTVVKDILRTEPAETPLDEYTGTEGTVTLTLDFSASAAPTTAEGREGKVYAGAARLEVELATGEIFVVSKEDWTLEWPSMIQGDFLEFAGFRDFSPGAGYYGRVTTESFAGDLVGAGLEVLVEGRESLALPTNIFRPTILDRIDRNKEIFVTLVFRDPSDNTADRLLEIELVPFGLE